MSRDQGLSIFNDDESDATRQMPALGENARPADRTPARTSAARPVVVQGAAAPAAPVETPAPATEPAPQQS